MEAADLKQIGESIAEKIPVEKIYGISYADSQTASNLNNGTHHHLIIIVPATCGIKFTELEPFVRMVTHASPAITYTFYQTGEIRCALKKGNLLLHIACTESNLLYEQKGSAGLPQSNAESLLAWKCEANSQFKDGSAKAKSFLDGANFYNDRNDAGLTVFMLHQFIELTFRTLELALLAKEKKTHSITLHQALVAPLLPQLGVMFPANTPEEKEILETLNGAYAAVRYEQHYQVNEALIPILFERAYLLQKRAEVIITELNALLDIKIKEVDIQQDQIIVQNLTVNLRTIEEVATVNDSLCKDGSANSEIYASPVLDIELEPLLNEVIVLISDHLDADQIYVFGNRKVQSSKVHLFDIKEPLTGIELHYDLLVISPLSNPYGKNIQSMANSLDGVSVNLFVHTKEEALKQLENHNRFFTTVLQHGKLVYAKTEFYDLENITNIHNHDNPEHAAALVTRRMLRAKAILKAAELVKDDVPDVTVYLLAQSLEQACLGLIGYFLSYVPNLHSPSHLLNICNMFLPEDRACFPMETGQDQRLLNMLSQSHHEMRYRAGRTIDLAELKALYARCDSFISGAEKVWSGARSDMEMAAQSARI